VNFNSGKLLEKCLDSIKRFPPDCDYEIIVVDNGSADGNQSTVLAWDRVRFVQNNWNAGFAGGNNQAFQMARGEYFLLMNPDTEARKGALDSLIDCADAHPGAGLISARLINPDGTTQVGFNIRCLPGLLTAFNQLLMIDEVWPTNPLTRRYMGLDLDYDKPQAVEQPAASALLYRRTTWEKVGEFDIRFSNWYNDVDLCKRVRDGGWEIIYCPSAHVMHHGGMGSASRALARAVVEVYRSQRLYFFKHFGPWGYKADSVLIIIGMFMRQLVLTIMPGMARSVNTRVNHDRPDALRLAFKRVLHDTLHTWTSLPAQFQTALKE
jgi:GT2 family glycosyltransferase